MDVVLADPSIMGGEVAGSSPAVAPILILCLLLTLAGLDASALVQFAHVSQVPRRATDSSLLSQPSSQAFDRDAIRLHDEKIRCRVVLNVGFGHPALTDLRDDHADRGIEAAQ